MERDDEVSGTLVEIGNFPTPIDGAMAQARLEGAGIDAVLFDTELATSWVYTNALGGVRLMVAAENEEAARALLAADANSLAVNDAAAVPDEDQIALDHPETWCPDCHSKDVETLREAPRGWLARLFNPGPALHCRACGHHWRWLG